MLPKIAEGAFKQEEDKLKEVVKNVKLITNQADQKNSSESADKVGRNEKLNLVKGDQEIQVKYKKIDQYLKEGWQLKK